VDTRQQNSAFPRRARGTGVRTRQADRGIDHADAIQQFSCYAESAAWPLETHPLVLKLSGVRSKSLQMGRSKTGCNSAHGNVFRRVFFTSPVPFAEGVGARSRNMRRCAPTAGTRTTRASSSSHRRLSVRRWERSPRPRVAVDAAGCRVALGCTASRVIGGSQVLLVSLR
jgi:hypothetical protein